MEARNFVTAREMVQNGNWLLPTMNDQPRITKPPLPTWLSASIMLLTGDLDALGPLRFPAAISATLMIFFVFGLARKFASDPLSPFLVAIVLATCFYVTFLGRQGTWDIFCHSFMLLAIWCLYEGWHSVRHNYFLFFLAGLAMGLSFLSKGPVSFYTVLLPFLIAYFICFDSSAAKFNWRGMAMTILTAIIISAIWPLYIYLNQPDLATSVAETESGSWVTRNVRPFWYYWNFTAHSGIWVVMGIVVMIWPYAKPRINQFGNYKFFLLWLMAALILLSVIPEKKVRYLLPVFIPFSFLVGNYLNYLINIYKEKKESAWDKRILLVNTVIFLTIAVAVPLACFLKFYRNGSMSFSYWIVSLLFYSGLAYGLIYSYRSRNVMNLILIIVILNTSIYFLLFPLASPLIYTNPHYQSLTATRELAGLNDGDLYYLNENEEIRPERIWEIGRPVKQWKYKNKCHPPQDTPFVLFSKLPPEELFKGCEAQFTYELIKAYEYRKEKTGEFYYVGRLIPAE